MCSASQAIRGCWDRFLYGTDWPIVNLAEYRDYVTRIVPEERRPAVFFDNANRVYQLGLPQGRAL